MSTAGKVLTVVVILALAGWIFLFAQIAQLNANWGQKIDQLTEQVKTLETDVAQTRQTLDTRIAEITLSQDQRDRAMTVLKSRLAHVEKLQALNQEALVRAGLQIELLKTGNTQAEKGAGGSRQGEAADQRLDRPGPSRGGCPGAAGRPSDGPAQDPPRAVPDDPRREREVAGTAPSGRRPVKRLRG